MDGQRHKIDINLGISSLIFVLLLMVLGCVSMTQRDVKLVGKTQLQTSLTKTTRCILCSFGAL